MVNHKLRAARKGKCWTIAVAAEKAGVSWLTYSRWEQGAQTPYLSTLDQLCKAFERTPQELGFAHLVEEPLEEKPDGKVSLQLSHPSSPPEASGFEHLVSGSQASVPPRLQTFTITEDQLTALASLLKLGDTIMFDPTKRKTLETLLTTLSLAGIKPEGFWQSETLKHMLEPEIDLTRVNEMTIQGYAKLIEACWQLSRGNELALAEKLLPECLTKLVPLAQQPSKYQKAAANLAAQGFRIYGILALHRNDLQARELYVKQAIQYSQITGDQNLLISSLVGLAETYKWGNQYPQMLQTYLKASQHAKDVSPLLQSRVHSGLAVAYAHLDQEQEALTSLGTAIDTFPDAPEKDASFSFAEFGLPWLIETEVVVRTRLGQTKRAFDIFSRIEQPGITVPERIRIQIINHQAKTAIFSGNLEQGSSYIGAGVAGAKTLGSHLRLKEAYDNYKQMIILWPQEKQVKELGELFYA